MSAAEIGMPRIGTSDGTPEATVKAALDSETSAGQAPREGGPQAGQTPCGGQVRAPPAERPGPPPASRSRGLGGPWLDERRLAPVETIQPRRRDGGLLAERHQDRPPRPHRRQTVEARDLRRR